MIVVNLPEYMNFRRKKLASFTDHCNIQSDISSQSF